MKLFWLPTVALQFGEKDASPPSEVQILKAGTFKHPRYGRFTITPETLKRFVENFDAKVRGIEIQANYDHGTSKAHGSKAAGWIRALTLKAEGQELWAAVEWTEQAKNEIKASEWKYTSAEIDFEWEHPEDPGKKFAVVEGFALTNTPFIKGMQRIAASENYIEEDQPMKLSEMKAALIAEHGINVDDLQAQAKKVSGLEADKVALSERAATAEGQVKKLAGEVADLTAKVELHEKEAKTVKLAALIKTGMEQGKLTKAFAEGKFTEMAEKMGLEFAEGWLKDAPKVVDVDAPKGHGGGGEGGSKKFKTPDLEVTAKAEELMAKDSKLSFADAAKQVLLSDKKLSDRYHAYQGEASKGEDAE